MYFTTKQNGRLRYLIFLSNRETSGVLRYKYSVEFLLTKISYVHVYYVIKGRISIGDVFNNFARRNATCSFYQSLLELALNTNLLIEIISILKYQH